MASLEKVCSFGNTTKVFCSMRVMQLLSYVRRCIKVQLVPILIKEEPRMKSQLLQRVSILIWFAAHTLALIGAEAKKIVSVSQEPLDLQQSRATREGSQALLHFLTEHPERINSGDSDGWLPLAIVAERGERSIVASLLEKKADVNLKSFRGMTPLHMVGGEAFYRYPIGIAALLLGYNHPNQRYTCKDEQADCMKLLLKAKADIHALDDDKHTPLICALGRYCPEQVKTLLAAGALMPEDLIRRLIQARNEQKDDIRQCGMQACIEVIKAHNDTTRALLDRIEQEEAAREEE